MTSEAAAALAGLQNPAAGVVMRTMYVDAVRDDGRVNLRDGEAIVPGVACLPTYAVRAAEDQVVVLRARSGMVVLGTVGTALQNAASSLDISWGSGPPSGAGWVTGVPYVRDGALYLDTSQTPSTTPSGGGSTSAPRPVTLQPSDRAAWRSGHLESDRPVAQGAWPSYPQPFTGGWFYGGAVAAACAGKSVKAMQLKLARSGAPHGSYGQVRPQMYLVAAGSPGSTPPSYDPDAVRYGPGLGLGGSATWSLPAAWRADLASGAARGIVVSAGVGIGYLIYSSSSGALTITFD